MADYRCPITLSHYNFADYLVQNSSVYAPITFEEIVIVKIRVILMSIVTPKTKLSLQPITKNTDNLVNQSKVEEDACSRHPLPP